jgi:hypothetical protein
MHSLIGTKSYLSQWEKNKAENVWKKSAEDI